MSQSDIDAIETQINSLLVSTFNVTDVVNVDSAVGNRFVANGEITNPYASLNGCNIFIAHEDVQEEAFYARGVIGIYKNGNIEWYLESGLNVYFSMASVIFSVRELNNDNKVEIVTSWFGGTKGGIERLFIVSWDGLTGTTITEVDATDQPTIISTSSVFKFLDIDGNSTYEVIGDWYENENAEETSPITYSWNGIAYGKWISVPQPLPSGFYPRNNLTASIKAFVKIDSGFYAYRYSLQNSSTSKQSINEFILATSPDTVFNDISPVEWVLGGVPAKALGWMGLPGFNMFIKQDLTDSSFYFETPRPPAIVQSLIRGDNGNWIDVLGDGAEFTLDQWFDEALSNSYKVMTIGPAVLSAPFIPLNFLDTLSSYTTQSRTLGWITTQPIADKYLGYFATAKTQLQAGNNNGARGTLQQVLADVNVDSSSTLTSEAYALLQFNTEYLIAKLPAWQPQNVQSAFLTPQKVSVTWDAEYSATMLPNGGGYDLYRAIHYDGSALSFTKLNSALIAAGTYTDYPAISPTIPANKNVYLKYYLVAKNNQGVYSISSDTVSLFVGKTVSGTISANTTWNENKIIVGDVTVSSGYTLTISSGITIRFAGGTDLTSNGVFTASGTLSSPITFTSLQDTVPGSWGSIILQISSTALSRIEYAQIEYGNEMYALNIPGSGVFISNCTFKKMINAVLIENSNAWVIDSKILTPRDHGITAYNYATVACYHNTITKTDQTGAGILYTGGAYDYTWGNKVSGFEWGMGATWGSSPTLGHPSNTGINNLVTNSQIGFMIYNWSYPIIGYPTSWDDGLTYGNNIFGNFQNLTLNMTPDDYIYANNVYWGTTDPQEIQNLLGIGEEVYGIDVADPLTNNTWPPEGLMELPRKKLNALKKLSAPLKPNRPVAASEFAEVDLREGIKLRLKGKYVEAKDFFKAVIAANPKNSMAYLELYKTFNDTTRNDIIQVFSQHSNEAPVFAKMLQANIFRKERNIASAKQINETIADLNPNNHTGIQAKLNNFYITLHDEQKPVLAKRILDELMKKPEPFSKIDLYLAKHALDVYNKRYEKMIKK